jgi:hypothetical protein
MFLFATEVAAVPAAEPAFEIAIETEVVVSRPRFRLPFSDYFYTRTLFITQ